MLCWTRGGRLNKTGMVSSRTTLLSFQELDLRASSYERPDLSFLIAGGHALNFGCYPEKLHCRRGCCYAFHVVFWSGYSVNTWCISSFSGPVRLHRWPPHGNGSNFELSSQCVRVHEQPRGSEQPSSVTFLPTRVPPPLQHPRGPIAFSCRLSGRKQPVTIWPNFSCKYSRYSPS